MAILIVGLVMVCAACEDRSSPARTESTLRFADITEYSGLPAAGMTSGAVLVDLDGDGLRDLLLGRHAGVPEAYRNRGDLRFARLDKWGGQMDVWDHHATLVDDFDGDGRDDLYFVAGAHRGDGIGDNALYLSSDGFTEDAAARWGMQDPFGRGRGAIWLDLDADAVGDLVVLNFKTAPRAYRIEGAGPMPDMTKVLFEYQAAEDAIVAAAYENGLPTGELRYRSDYMYRLLPQDIAGDGQPELLSLGGPSVRLQRLKDGVFRADLPALPPEVYVPAPVGAAWGDLDNDGASDLYLVYGEDDQPRQYGRERRNRLLQWRGERFMDRADSLLAMEGHGRDCAAADLDNNGSLDLIVLQSNRGANVTRLRILLNDGAGGFTESGAAPPAAADMPGIADGILIEDLDADGDLDLLVLLGAIGHDDPGGGLRLYRNDLQQGNWLRIVLEDTTGAVPYGARVEIACGSHVQHRQFWPSCVNGSAFRGALHIGLGQAAEVDRLTVMWPSGRQTVLRNVAANRVLTLKHP